MRYNDFEGGGGHSFFPTMIYGGRWGGCRKFPTKMTSSIGGGGGGGDNHFFPEKRKGNENMLLDALIIPVFYFISKKMLIKN